MAHKLSSFDDPQLLLYTPDGASTFEVRHTFNPQQDLVSLQMIDSTFGYALAYSNNNFFWRTTDGGYSWEDITDTAIMHQNAPIQYGARIFFLNRDTGFIGGNSYIYKTTDGCQTWTRCNTPTIIDSTTTNNYFVVNNIYFTNEKYGWAVCTYVYDNGFGMKTTDGGLNWSICTSVHFPNMNDVNSSDSLECGMVGFGGFITRIALTEDNFENYSHLYGNWDIDIGANTIAYQNDSTIWIGGNIGKLKRSKDRGATFTDFLPDTIPIDNTFINKIRFFDSTGYAIGFHNANHFLLKFVDTLNVSSLDKTLLCDDISISPNPTSDIIKLGIHVQSENNANIELYSMEGELIQRSEKILCTGINEVTMNVHDQLAGIYMVCIRVNDAKFFKKIIKIN